MSDEGIIQFTFGLDEPELEDEQRLKFAKKLLRELRNLDEVERAERTEDLTPETGSKPRQVHHYREDPAEGSIQLAAVLHAGVFETRSTRRRT